MIGTIRKHQTWLWVLIMTATIISFVIFFSPTSRVSGRSGEVHLGSIDGHAVSKEEYLQAQNEVRLRYFFSSGQWPEQARDPQFDLQKETYYWLLFTKELNDFDIHVDSASVAKMANSILTSLGRGQPVPFKTFVDQLLTPNNVSAEDFQQYLRHQLGMEQLVSVVGLSADLVTPQEAQAVYERENRELESSAVFFSGSNYLARVAEPTPQALAQFYTNRMAAYRIPERVQVAYVEFPISNHLAEAEQELTNISEIVQANMEQLGTNYTRLGKTEAEAEKNLRERIIHQQATMDTRKVADQFASTLYDMEPMQASNIFTLAKSNGLTAQITQPFDQENGPSFDGGPNFATRAFALSPDEPFAGPLVGDEALYDIAFYRKIPSEIPPLTQLHDKVLADYKYSEATAMARSAGSLFAHAVTNELAAGKTFAAAASASGVQPVNIQPFSISTRQVPEAEQHEISLLQFKQVAFSTEPGKASPFVPTRDGGFVVYVQKKLPIDQAKMKQDMPTFIRQLRQSRRQEAFGMWFQQQEQKYMADTPLAQPKQTPPSLAPVPGGQTPQPQS